MKSANFCGGNASFIRPSVIHLKRGQVFNLQGKTFFTFGGAKSHDIRDGILEPGDPRIKKWNKDYNKMFRINGVSWWKEELPSQEEMDEGIRNLSKENNKVDYILTLSANIYFKTDGWWLQFVSIRYSVRLFAEYKEKR